MPTPNRKLSIFLCHASQDKPILRELYKRLLAEGWIDPWLDEEKLLPGQDWDMEIEKAVENADAVIVCLSNNSVTKEGYVQKELKYVLDIAIEKPEGAIFIIPLRLDECQVPRRIRSWQYADYFPAENRDKGYKRLLVSLHERESALRLRDKFNNLIPEKPLNILPNDHHKTFKNVGQSKYDLSGEKISILRLSATLNGLILGSVLLGFLVYIGGWANELGGFFGVMVLGIILFTAGVLSSFFTLKKEKSINPTLRKIGALSGFICGIIASIGTIVYVFYSASKAEVLTDLWIFGYYFNVKQDNFIEITIAVLIAAFLSCFYFTILAMFGGWLTGLLIERRNK